MGLIKQRGIVNAFIKVGDVKLNSGDIVKLSEPVPSNWLFLSNDDAKKRLEEVDKEHFTELVEKQHEHVFVAVPKDYLNQNRYYVYCKKSTYWNLGEIMEIPDHISLEDLNNLTIYEIWDKYKLQKL